MNIKKLVIKLGTSTIYNNGSIDIEKMEKIISVISTIKKCGIDIVLVTSGAIGLGVSKLGLSKKPDDMPTKQAAASIGQCELMNIYDTLFSKYGHMTSQILLTKDIIDDEVRKSNVFNTIEKLISLDVIPIVNENDTISTEEIEFGDNDNLSAVVCSLLYFDTLIIVSDIDGLYDSDPNKNKDAKLIHVVEDITDDILSFAENTNFEFGTGGMITKLQAAMVAKEKNFNLHIVNGSNPDNLIRVIRGDVIGTSFTFRR